MRGRRITLLPLLLLKLAGTAQSFILGFQLSSAPNIQLKNYPYPDRNATPVDLTNCQEGPGEEVLAVGVINGVSQGIAMNTRQKMKGIALWRDPGCPPETPDYLISWREGVDGMQLADMALAGSVIVVGSWMDLEGGNTLLQRLGPPFGYIYKFGVAGAGTVNLEGSGDIYDGERIYVEEGMPVITRGQRKTLAAVKLELMKKAAVIRRAFLTVDEVDSGGETPEGVGQHLFDTDPNPWASASGGGEQHRLEQLTSMLNTIDPQSQRQNQGQQPQNMMSNPFLGLLHGPQLRNTNSQFQGFNPYQPVYFSGPQMVQRPSSHNGSIKPSKCEWSRAELATGDEEIPGGGTIPSGIRIGAIEPMASVDEVQRRTDLMRNFLSNADDTTIEDIGGEWPTIRMDKSRIPPDLRDDPPIKDEGEPNRAAGGNEQVLVDEGGERDVIEEITMSRDIPGFGPGVMDIPQHFGDNPYYAQPPIGQFGWGFAGPDPNYQDPYPYYNNFQGPQREQLPPGWPTSGQFGTWSMQESYPRILSEMYNAQQAGGQLGEQDPEIQFAGYEGQDEGPNIDENSPNDENQRIQFEAGIGAGGVQVIPRAGGFPNPGNVQDGDQIVEEEQLFEEEYSPMDDGDFFADDENFSGETRLSGP
ncbi:hypothetical protein TWF481_004617 [Arthrobotrys musiformis]|uniref:Uncharacterized protein n=1 Tax=Arthrobotrys musiformis TaxID=47236 RepID=A0AAV9WM27_9PEZI